MQLEHPFVQKWTTTTLPFWSASLSGFEFTQSVTPVNSGAGTRGLSPSTADDEVGLGSGSPPRPRTAQAPRHNPSSTTATIITLVFIFDLRVWNLGSAATNRALVGSMLPGNAALQNNPVSQSGVPRTPPLRPSVGRPLLLEPVTGGRASRGCQASTTTWSTHRA